MSENAGLSPKDLLEHIKGRINHPFWGSFTIAFFTYNWRILLLSVSGDWSPDTRISEIIKITIQSLENPNWEFLTNPIKYALAFVILFPIGSLLVEVFFHFVKVMERNVKDWLTKKFDKSMDIKYRNSVQIVGYARGQLGQIRNKTNGQTTVQTQDILTYLDEATEVLEPISRDNAEEISRRLEILKNQKKII